MTSERCRSQKCPYFDKVSGKAVCKYRRLEINNVLPNDRIRHMRKCIKEECKDVLIEMLYTIFVGNAGRKII
jgi:hypothetical protein